MYWNILVWLRIEIPDGFLHQISENLKIDDLVTGGTINLQLTLVLVMILKLRAAPIEDGPFLTLTGVLVPAVSVRT